MKLTVHELRKKLQLFEIQTVSISIRLSLTVTITFKHWLSWTVWSAMRFIFICIPVHRNLGDVVC